MKIDETDKWFSIYIRIRDSDDNGICKCYTCNNMFHWKRGDCGHYVKRQHSGTRFNEKNCHAQCKECNWLKQGNDAIYKVRLIAEYGQQEHDILKSAERQSVKHTTLELKLLAEEYKKKAKELAKLKGIEL